MVLEKTWEVFREIELKILYSQVMSQNSFNLFGLRVWQGEVAAMDAPHQHSELELNWVSRGQMNYLFGGRMVKLEAGSWLVFWGALPHRLIEVAPRTHCTWLTLPLATFLRFSLPETLTSRVLHGEPMLERNPLDEAMFSRWVEDWRDPNEDSARILELELEARLRRLARTLPSQRSQARGRALKPVASGANRAVQLAQLIAEHYLEAVQISDLAQTAGLNPNYAASLFKETFSMTMLEYLTQHRLAHAQRLLATTEQPILEIAFASGFGSASRFYAAFERATGVSPLKYRHALRTN